MNLAKGGTDEQTVTKAKIFDMLAAAIELPADDAASMFVEPVDFRNVFPILWR